MKKPIPSVRKFYLLEYFYILLKSVQKTPDQIQVFEQFKLLKHQYQLGESKYKKISVDLEKLSQRQLVKYKYTFNKVQEECLEYGLIQMNQKKIYLRTAGEELLKTYERSPEEYSNELCRLMENNYNAFRYLIELMYRENRLKNGLLVFPVYSPLQLGQERKNIKISADIYDFCENLRNRLEQDISNFLSEEKNLSKENDELIRSLIEDQLISEKRDREFSPKKYNAIIKRIRDYWLKFFLQKIYHYDYYLTSFEIWTYRAKQIGIIYATEFYPYFNGKVVYPTSVINSHTSSKDFVKIVDYPDNNKLFVHTPDINNKENQEQFIDELLNAYFDLRKNYRSYFINLSALKEVVCFKLRISENGFQKMLDSIYKDNLRGKHKIKISLEVDRLPEETKATYLKQAPVLIDGKYRNIIALDLT